MTSTPASALAVRRKGERMDSPVKVYPLSRMQRLPEGPEGDDDCLPWIEVGRGEYHYESGHWWWQGWDMNESRARDQFLVGRGGRLDPRAPVLGVADLWLVWG